MTQKEKIVMLLMRKTESSRFDTLLSLVDQLMECDLVRYREKDDDPEFGHPEDLYWESCGDSIFGDGNA